MATISDISALQVFDSRGNPTIEVTVRLDNDIQASSSVPSGASKGTYEAIEIRDQNPQVYNGLGVTKAIQNISEIIAPALQGYDADVLSTIDKKMIELDGTQNKAKLGANAMLGVSQAVAKAAAASQRVPLFEYIRSLTAGQDANYELPTPLFNMIEGGQHADNGLNFQEYMVVPASQKSFSQKMEIGVSIYHSLKRILLEKNFTSLVADEAGFGPELSSNLDALVLLKTAIEHAGYQFALDAFLGLDIAANNFIDTNNYKLIDRSASYSPNELIEFYKHLASDYSLLYLEDPFSEEDIASWRKLHAEGSVNTLIVGDDLTVTNPYRLQMALDNNAISGIIIKPNQIGTVTEAIAVSEMSKFKGLKVIVSHRSGETTDSFIADFAVGVGADYVKFGAPAHERVAKYNRLLEIEKVFSEASRSEAA